MCKKNVDTWYCGLGIKCNLCSLNWNDTSTFNILTTGPAGDSDNFYHEQRGIIPRSFEYLFKSIERQNELVSVSSDVYYLLTN